MKTIIQSFRIYLVITVLTGIIYPTAMTRFAQFAFPRQANGSCLTSGDKLIGSELLAQKFVGAKYFWPRPSFADFATVASGASNKGPTSADLKKSIEERRVKFGKGAPVDLLTASASGLDSHISPEAARLQIARVAAARSLAPAEISRAVDHAIERPQFGFLGEPRVNVLLLNRRLDTRH